MEREEREKVKCRDKDREPFRSLGFTFDKREEATVQIEKQEIRGIRLRTLSKPVQPSPL